MRLRFAVVISVLCVSVAWATEDLESKPSNLHEAPPVKLDKTLRRALLKALSDLEAESLEQHAKEDSEEEFLMDEASPKNFDVAEKKELEKSFAKSTFSFSNFQNDEEPVSEDELQNSTFIEIERFVSSDSPVTLKTVVDKPKEFLKGFQVTDSISPEKSSAIYETKQDQEGSRSVKSLNPSSANAIKTSTSKSTTQFTETLVRSESNGIAVANSLVSPKPTVSSPTVSPVANVSSTSPKPNKEEEEDAEDVKIFQAPLVAAFTVQQDERGIPKSVVPIYRPSGDGQALTLQEQLDFKQKLLEKQLLELQQQQVEQTQFLLRQQQAYEEQLRQKQQQEIFLQDQARLKQLQDQARLKQFEEQRQKQFEEEIRQKQLEEQRLYQQRLQQQQLQQQQLQQQQLQQQQIQQQQFQQQLNQQQLPIEQNNVLSFKQPTVSNNVRLQPSISLEVPHDIQATPIQPQFQDQLRSQQLRQQQQQQLQQQQIQQQQQLQQQQHLQQHQLQQQQQLQQNQHQQKLQQSFAQFTSDLQPPVASATRFNRQEAFGSVGNFGFNVDNRSPTRNTFSFNTVQQRSPQSVVYNQFPQFRQSRPPSSTPAKQIQHLLYQSGIANELQSGAQGFPGSQEDLNIVSKVLALNVGAVPSSNNLNNLQFAGSQRVNAYVRAPSVA